jgi:hypothetical protein
MSLNTSNPDCEYTNDGVRITAPGKFEGCPIFAPYFWSIALDGCADFDDGNVFTFRFPKGDKERINGKFANALNAWLGRSFTLKMREDSQGFVHCF